MKALVVTNFVTHYRAPFFERLALAMDVEFLLCSDGTEEFWQPHLGTTQASIRAEHAVGHRLVQGVTFNPRAVREMWRRDYDVVIKCINGRFELASAYSIAKARGIPFVFWMEIWWHPMNPLGWLSYPFLKTVEQGADAIVTDGPQMTRFVAGNGIDPAKIFTATIAVDNDVFTAPVDVGARDAFRRRIGLSPADDGRERPLLLAVARLVPEKGLAVLLRAAARLADLRPALAIIGTGPLGASLTDLAEQLGVDLHLIGGLAPREMPAAYAAADVYVMPSVTTPKVREPWGLGVNEAMCCGVPVVVSDAVGAAAGGLATHRETALVVPERDPEALAAAVRTVLSDEELAAQLVAEARRRVGGVTLDAAVAQFVSACQYAVAARGRSRRRPCCS